MSRPFTNTSSANRAFGEFNEPKDASEYLYNKKARSTYCVANKCHPSIKVYSESDRLLFNKSNQLSLYPCRGTINPASLNINLITRLNLSGVAVIKDMSNNITPSTINAGLIPYLNYEIDPNGNLFGNSICGINNFKYYLRPEINLSSNITINGNYLLSSDASYNTIITFIGNSSIKIIGDLIINYIAVGGGGGGGGGNAGGSPGGGGGGGGRVLTGTIMTTILSSYNIIIGNGGTPGQLQTTSTPSTNGGDGGLSQISSVTTAVGGFGGKSSQNNGDGGNSGSGSGTGGTSPGGNGTNGGGGGGGAYSSSQVGGNGASSTTSAYFYGTIFGAGGGGGGGNNPVSGKGGNAFAGNGGRPGSDGIANYGGGGGGGGSGNGVPGTYGSGGAGGSGVVIFLLNV